MRHAILRWAWQVVKPSLREWLDERALRLPAHQRDALAHRLGMPPQTVEQIATLLRQITLHQQERWNP